LKETTKKEITTRVLLDVCWIEATGTRLHMTSP